MRCFVDEESAVKLDDNAMTNDSVATDKPARVAGVFAIIIGVVGITFYLGLLLIARGALVDIPNVPWQTNIFQFSLVGISVSMIIFGQRYQAGQPVGPLRAVLLLASIAGAVALATLPGGDLGFVSWVILPLGVLSLVCLVGTFWSSATRSG